MSDDLLRSLALKAGIEPTWRDQQGRERGVSVATMRALLAAIGLPSANDESVRNSLAAIEVRAPATSGAHFFTARVGQPIVLPLSLPTGAAIEVEFETGPVRSVAADTAVNGLTTLPPLDAPGYHIIRTAEAEFTVATAPERSVTLADVLDGRRGWGLAAQIYSLRRPGDGGVGDFGSAARLAEAAAAHGADLLSLSPVHALFSAEPRHFSPYSPSNRCFYNPIHADPLAAFSADMIQNAIARTGVGDQMAQLEKLPLVDWPAATDVRTAILRALFAFVEDPENTDTPPAQDFDQFRKHATRLLRDHATFEVMHAHHLGQDAGLWKWADWPAEHRDPGTSAVSAFAAEHRSEVDFHIFAQWLAGKSFAECQRVCRAAGMRVGLVADLAIGMDGSGSHAWSRQQDILNGVSVGAPPDYYNSGGQNWGITGFSPRGLASSGFEPFIETLRASLRYTGGIRIDHVMGLSRLWLVPDGAPANEGAYLNYSPETLFRLVALESWRHNAIVIGEDLGTLPDGFREYLRDQGIAGLRVLRFERDHHGYRKPEEWDPTAVALSTTHDLVPTAGWWAGSDIEDGAGDEPVAGHAQRATERGRLWAEFRRSGVAESQCPPPHETDRVVDAAVSFLAKTPCAARILSIEDACGIRQQPNVPGTTTEKPNWRHRLEGTADALLDDDRVRARLKRLSPQGPDTCR